MKFFKCEIQISAISNDNSYQAIIHAMVVFDEWARMVSATNTNMTDMEMTVCFLGLVSCELFNLCAVLAYMLPAAHRARLLPNGATGRSVEQYRRFRLQCSGPRRCDAFGRLPLDASLHRSGSRRRHRSCALSTGRRIQPPQKEADGEAAERGEMDRDRHVPV